MNETKETYPIPAILSLFVPGLGQLVKKDYAKSVIIFLSYVMSLILIFLFVGLIFAPIIWVYGIYDAYNAPGGN